MANLVKIVKKMLEIPSDMRFDKVVVVLEAFGYKRGRASGSSHFVYRKKGCHSITVPKENNKVKKHYLKDIVFHLNLEVWYEKNSQ
jgi:predicted RNA binding protein YcfA (HicA-like mRNA interferase family)